MGEGGLRFQIAGIPVSLPLGGVLAVLLIAYLWACDLRAARELRTLSGRDLRGAAVRGVLVHELAHAWAARSFGYPVQGITLWLLGGYTVYERRDSKPGPEFVISVVGPLSTLAIAAGCWVLAGVTSGSVSVLLSALAFTNLLLGALNLLPGAPLDGGGIVKSAVWRATGSRTPAHAAGYAGLIVAGLVRCAGGGAAEPRGRRSVDCGARGVPRLRAYQSLQSAKQGPRPRLGHPRLPQMIRPVLAVSEADRLDAVLAVGSGVPGRGGDRGWPGRLLAALSLAAADAVPADQRGRSQWVLSRSPFRPSRGLSWTTSPPGCCRPCRQRPVRGLRHRTRRAPAGVLMAADVNRARPSLRFFRRSLRRV